MIKGELQKSRFLYIYTVKSNCLYITRYNEFLDMTPPSITSIHIDDVLLVRKVKRMSSNIRQEFRSAEDRRVNRGEYINFLETAKYHVDVFQRIIDNIQTMADDSDPTAKKVLKRGFF